MIKQTKKIGDATLYCADCKDVLPLLKDIDACVTDPPYGLSFMGKAWDYDVPGTDIWTQVHDVLKPGAHLLSFFGSRTYHRGAIPIEDAGFEIRDQLMWLYGSGFPKSHNIGKALDKYAGVKRRVVGKIEGMGYTKSNVDHGTQNRTHTTFDKLSNDAVTPEAKRWEGWGTALKPAHEPIVMARKPFKGSVAKNVLEHGVGGINIDECRVGNEERTYKGMSANKPQGAGTFRDDNWQPKDIEVTAVGRFPANVMHDGSEVVQDVFGDKSRYFYCAKASKQDRDEGLENFVEAQTTDGNIRSNSETARKFGANSALRKNVHPTVKPTELMRYLCRLVTPKGGVVLDPFMGSGSTGKAAVMSGYKFVGVEVDEEYFEIACARVEAAHKQRGLF